MRTIEVRRVFVLALAAAAFTLPTAAAAQFRPLAVEVRGGLNWAMSDLKNGLGEEETVNGPPVAAAENGGYTASANVYWTFAQRGAIYLGWTRASFDCKEEFCGSDGRLWSAGPEMGFKFSMQGDRSFAPWVRGGLIAHKAKFKEGEGLEENSVRSPGFEVGFGTDIGIGSVLALSPGIHYYRYSAGWDLGTAASKRVKKNIGWFQTDIGLQLRLGGAR